MLRDCSKELWKRLLDNFIEKVRSECPTDPQHCDI